MDGDPVSERPRIRVNKALAEPPIPELELVAIMITTDPAHHARVQASAPESMQVHAVSTALDLAGVFARFPVLCAVVFDMGTPKPVIAELLESIESRWPNTARMAVQASNSPKVFSEALALTEDWAFLPEDETTGTEEVAGFLRKAVDQRLLWAARLLIFAHRRDLTGAALETFVAYAIRQVRRSELEGFLGLASSAVGHRGSKLSHLLGGEGGLAEVGQRLMAVPPVRPQNPLLVGIEAAAIAYRARTCPNDAPPSTAP